MIMYVLLRLSIVVFGYLPFWFLYRLSDVLSFICYYFGIRRETIEQNLEISFPNKSQQQMRQLTKSVYRNFFDVMVVEMLKNFTISGKMMRRRFDPGDISIAKDYYAKGRSLILVLGHYANWEWGVSVTDQYKCVAFYKPLKNKYIDRYVKRNRARHQFILASIMKPLPTFLKYRDQQTAYFLLADKQNAKKRHLKRVIWLPFLGQDTPFLLGPAKYAEQFNYPILYSKIMRVSRGHYKHELILISENPASEDPVIITERWVRTLEQQVTQDPASWLWFFATTRSRQRHTQVET